MIDTLETNDMVKASKRDAGDEKSVQKTQRKDYRNLFYISNSVKSTYKGVDLLV